MLGHGPYFTAEIDDSLTNPFHPKSPAGKFCEAETFSGKMKFEDPHRGLGGFGCSGAEFLACWSLKHKEMDAWKAWDASREFPGSGADILTQSYGMNQSEPFFLAIDLKARKLEKITPHLGLTLSLFRTGQKLPTHEHLQKLPEIPNSLAEITERGISAMASGNRADFLAAISQYAKTLEGLGLISEFSKSVLGRLGNDILAAKGCGAMGADVLLVAHDKADLKTWEKENSLTQVAQISV